MRILLTLLAILSQAAYALDDCPGARWTQNSAMYTEGCAGFKCMSRTILSENKERCAWVVYTIQPEKGGFTSEIFDRSGKVKAREHFFVDPTGEYSALRTDVMDADGVLKYYLDKDEVAHLPDGSELSEDAPNPAGAFYEQIIQVPFQEDP